MNTRRELTSLKELDSRLESLLAWNCLVRQKLKIDPTGTLE